MMKSRTMTMLTAAVLGMMATSCGNSNKNANDLAASEGVEVGEEVLTVASDSSAEEVVINDSIVTRGGTASEGFGRCSKCSCKEFEGRGDVCKNCGHAYKAHY